jgi:hypothetical protein
MGLLDFLTGRRAPAPGAARLTEAELRAALLGLNRDTSPVVIRIARDDEEGADLVAEWRIVDARWYEIFAKAGLSKVAQVHLRLDDGRSEARAVLREWTVEWRAGIPTLKLSGEAFRGRKMEVSWGKAWAFREEDLRFGKVYDWTFDTRALERPLQEVVASCGWTWRAVAFAKL